MSSLKMNSIRFVGFCLLALGTTQGLRSEESIMDPGTLRISNDLRLGGVFHAARPGWHYLEDGVNKRWSHSGNEDQPWKAEWEQSLFTDVESRVSDHVYGRALLEIQGDYADRYWRPVDINHLADKKGDHFIFREAEGKIAYEKWYLEGFTGIPRSNWEAAGDFFALYPATFEVEDYLGISGQFGIYPARWNERLYLNVSDRPIPRGGEAGFNAFGFRGAVAYGNELAWGYEDSVYGRVSYNIGKNELTFVGQNADAPFALDSNERDRAYALSGNFPVGESHLVRAGVILRPYRSGESYLVAQDVGAGSGAGGSSTSISQKTSSNEDGLGARLRVELNPDFLGRIWSMSADYTHLGILAGNKDEFTGDLGTHVTPFLRADIRATYRRPIEGPIPFLYEGTPDNIGNIIASPRGPESPFTVDWSNREAVFFLTTFQLNPQENISMFEYDPHSVSMWNVRDQKARGLSVAGQYRLSDYRTATDRQYYHDSNGNIVWESAASPGAFASKAPLHEFRLLGMFNRSGWGTMVGIAGGQSPAISGLAYNPQSSASKSLTEYFSIELSVSHWPFTVWSHYGSGIWGPEPHLHRFFGLSYDRLYGGGISYNITTNTSLDTNYLAARQDDDQFVAPDLGSFDEFRTMLSHRFGFELQFRE